MFLRSIFEGSSSKGGDASTTTASSSSSIEPLGILQKLFGAAPSSSDDEKETLFGEKERDTLEPDQIEVSPSTSHPPSNPLPSMRFSFNAPRYTGSIRGPTVPLHADQSMC